VRFEAKKAASGHRNRTRRHPPFARLLVRSFDSDLFPGLLEIEWVIFRVLSAFSGIFLMIPGMIAVRLKGANPIQVQATTEVRLGCQFKSAGPAHVPLFPLSRWL